MPTEYSLQELSRLADVTPRTIRYYIVGGLLPAPTQSGPLARYSEMHLDRLRLIKKLQAAHLPLAEIRSRLSGMADAEISTIAEEEAFPPPSTNSAADYIRDVLGGTSTHPSAALPEQPMVANVALPRMESPGKPAKPPPGPEPDRAQWERISLDPDVELHVRRPLTRQLNKRVDRLIAIARQLLEEE
ncbi:MAG TPA: MerR family transcriptional regulator [Candidatus Limnocylindrales bacterium]|jgi:DNA-binding transcriptional MerR regulator|nr:MerR family transcriptional regulator [Candidatus Limnocylindrales bacterium]